MEVVDTVRERYLLDKKNNCYREYFLKFLMNLSCCMLNVQHNIGNDLTNISTRRGSVVDYCIVQHHQIEHFSQRGRHDNVVLTTTYMVPAGVVDPSQSVPDHSLLCAKLS